MDVFALRDEVVSEYRDYVESFINILDDRVRDFVTERLHEGELWPEAVLQLNPAYQPGLTLGELADQGAIRPETARFFGPGLRLHQHQQEALEMARREQPYIVSTGTGSGKSLTYLIPIFDHVIRNDPSRHSVRAVIVYPMNALINSQTDALREFQKNWPDSPVRFDSYTGQTRGSERSPILDDPPHILLTNYVMLEYMLIRPHERSLLAAATRELRFLVLDEMHVYRGRQGADVAMLVRRLRQKASANLTLIGTSATIASHGSHDERKAAIAAVGKTLFGVDIPARNVVVETLRPLCSVPAPATPEELRAAVQANPPTPTFEEVSRHPLAAWVETTFGVEWEGDRLVRRPPIAFKQGLDRLVNDTGLPVELCEERLRSVLDAGNRATTSYGEPVFAFRLHQFLSSGGTVYSTLEPPESRRLTMEGQYVAPEEDDGGRKLLYPLAFCRECGQEYYLVSRIDHGADHLDEGGGDLDNLVGQRLVPRAARLDVAEVDTPGIVGYFAIERDDLWSGNTEDLPESWFEQRRAGPRIKRTYEDHVPWECWVRPDGTVSKTPIDNAVRGWFQPWRLRLCLRCRAEYDHRDREYRKLSTLSQTGRSTATTVLTCGTVTSMQQDPSIDAAASKVLSFTDNRQDASLQAGHLNDFTQVALLRGALVRALRTQAPLTFDRLGWAVFEAIGLAPERFMREARVGGPGLDTARQTMIDLLEYRAFEDLRRAWRVAQPNLEQCGLLRIDYDGLQRIAADEAIWRTAPVIGDVPAPRREAVIRAVLDNLRSRMAIDAECLTYERVQSLSRRSREWLREPWAMDVHELPRRAELALLPDVEADERDQTPTFSLGARSAVGRYLRSRHTWGRAQDLTSAEVDEVVRSVVQALRGHILTVEQRGGQDYGVRIKAGALLWLPGDGQAARPDPIRARSLYQRRWELLRTKPNSYFERLYRDEALGLAGIVGHEHTGQVDSDARRQREDEFREGKLKALFCSPTMELGVDIHDLMAVHMRNVPPTPANYAQRSGRAGRGGRPALVVTFCSQGNAHDQYFFRRKGQMIAGAVAPARMDLANRELVEAHLHSVWLGMIGLDLGRSIDEMLDLESPGYPLRPEKEAQLEVSSARQAEIVAACQAVVANVDLSPRPDWLTDQWVEDVVKQAPLALARCFDRWRELYRAALKQRDDARRIIDSPRATRQDRETAEQREREAKREIDLLLNRGDFTESDFYPYRYVAAEGFLPGYNFPRLPLRAIVTAGDRSQAIDRARFVGLAEFGPNNVIYHEGRKHRIAGCIVPAGDLQRRLTRAKICLKCGYIHPGDDSVVDDCQHCGTRMDGATSQFPQSLFDQPAVRTQIRQRITAEEEERQREGYDISTHYRFAPSEPPRLAEVRGVDGATLLQVTYAGQARLWRINNGWRRSRPYSGFALDQTNGNWAPRPDDDDADNGNGHRISAPLAGVRPYVTDSRNILLIRVIGQDHNEPQFIRSLAYALQRGVQLIYQIEEREIEVDVVGRGEHQRLLLWEAAEGGTGVWERLLDDGFAPVAAEALRLCHFDPYTGQEDPAWAKRCGVACYDCLLSYSNQIYHSVIDRHVIKDLLLQLANSVTLMSTGGRDYDEHYRWLSERVDPASSLERDFLDALYQRRLCLPDSAQRRPSDEVAVQVDFYYERDGLPGICIFIDGPSHDTQAQTEHDRVVREALEDRGFRVVTIRYDQSLVEQIDRYPDVFGSI